MDLAFLVHGVTLRKPLEALRCASRFSGRKGRAHFGDHVHQFCIQPVDLLIDRHVDTDCVGTLPDILGKPFDDSGNVGQN